MLLGRRPCTVQFFLPYFGASCDTRYVLTSSHVSASSKLPMVTSKSKFFDFLHHAASLWKSRDFFACVVVFISWSDMSSYFEANVSAFLSSSSVIEGQNSAISKQMNECDGLSGILLSHSMNELVFLHWFKLVAATTLEMFLCRTILLMAPISDFAGLINLHVGLL